MSALPPKADICSALGDVCFVPIADMINLIDHLVGAVEQRPRNSDPERFGGLEIDRQLELDRAWTGSSLGFAPLRMRSAYVAARR